MDPMMMYPMGGYNSVMNNDLMMAPFLNNYQNQVSALDSYNRLNSDAMSMNGSIMPGFTGSFNYDQFYQNMEQNQERITNNQIRQTQRMRNVSFQANTPYSAIQKQVKALHTKIIEDEQEQITDAFEALKASVRAAYDPEGTADEEQISAQAEQEYYRLYGKELVEDIKDYSSGSFKQGFMQTVTFGLYDGVTAEENVARITGQPVGRKQQTLKSLGNAAGGAIIGATGLGLLSKVGFVAKLFKSKPLVAAALGGLLGAFAGPAVSQRHN